MSSLKRTKQQRVETFLSNIEIVDQCWVWAKSRRGLYGAFVYMGKQVYAHRWSYEIFNGPIPEGFYVLHRCDNPPCVNPMHFFLGTHKDNTQDAIKKGRLKLNYSFGEIHKTKTKCPKGHEYNWIYTYRGKTKRKCSVCINKRYREAYRLSKLAQL